MIDTAEQYHSSDRAHPEGDTERIIGSWLKKDKSRREKLVIAINHGVQHAKEHQARLEGSLVRLGTDYVDVYTLHRPARAPRRVTGANR